MIINIKTGVRKERISLEVEKDYYVETVKRMIMKRHGIWVGYQRLEFRWEEMLDDKTLVSYQVSDGDTLKLSFPMVKRKWKHLFKEVDFYDYEYPSFPVEMRNFAHLHKHKLKISKRDENPTTFDEETSRSFRDRILSIGSNGPLFFILSYIDPIELLYTQREVCKTFHECVFHLLESGNVTLNKIHFHILFGVNTCVPERLFLKLLKIFKDDLGLNLNDDIRFSEFPPNSLLNGKPTGLMVSAARRGYVEVLKYLRSCEMSSSSWFEDGHMDAYYSSPANKLLILPTICRRWKDDDPSTHDRVIHTLEFIIRTYPNFPNGLGEWDREHTISVLHKSKRWDLIYLLLEAQGESKYLEQHFIESLFTWSGQLPRDYVIPIVHFRKLKSLVEQIAPGFSFSPESMSYVPFDAVKELLVKDPREEEDPWVSTCRVKSEGEEWGRLLEGLENRGRPFFQFCIERQNDMVGKFYLPRIKLYLAGTKKSSGDDDDDSEVKKILEEYDRSKDNHIYSSFTGRAGHFKYELFEDPEIAKLVSEKTGIHLRSIVKIMSTENHPLGMNNSNFLRKEVVRKCLLDEKESSKFSYSDTADHVYETVQIIESYLSLGDWEEVDWILKNEIVPLKEMYGHMFRICAKYEGSERVSEYLLESLKMDWMNEKEDDQVSEFLLGSMKQKGMDQMFLIYRIISVMMKVYFKEQLETDRDTKKKKRYERLIESLSELYLSKNNNNLMTMTQRQINLLGICVIYDNVGMGKKLVEDLLRDRKRNLVGVVGSRVQICSVDLRQRHEFEVVRIGKLKKFLRKILFMQDCGIMVLECVGCGKKINIVEDFFHMTVCHHHHLKRKEDVKVQTEKEVVCYECLSEIQNKI